MTILDSNVWIAFFHKNDNQHKKAEKIIKELDTKIIIPEYIITEIASILCFKASKKIAVTFLESILDNNDIEILLSNKQIFNNTVNNFINDKNDKLSFVDTMLLCLSKKYQLITFDKNLQKAIITNNITLN